MCLQSVTPTGQGNGRAFEDAGLGVSVVATKLAKILVTEPIVAGKQLERRTIINAS